MARGVYQPQVFVQDGQEFIKMAKEGIEEGSIIHECIAQDRLIRDELLEPIPYPAFKGELSDALNISENLMKELLKAETVIIELGKLADVAMSQL